MHWQTSYFGFYLWISKLCPKKEILARACLIYMLFVASLWCWDPSISFLLMVIYCFDSTMFCSIFLKSSFKFFCFISNFPNDEILLWLSNDLLNFSQIQFSVSFLIFPIPLFPMRDVDIWYEDPLYLPLTFWWFPFIFCLNSISSPASYTRVPTPWPLWLGLFLHLKLWQS